MKLTALLAGLTILLSPTVGMTRTKRARFRIDSLKIKLKPKYRSAYRRARYKRSIRYKIRKMKRCFKAVVKKNPEYDGFLWLAVTFNKRGKVTRKTLTTTVKNAVAMKCMEWMVDFWKLPRGAVGKANAQVRIYAR
jgi:hypothetical protein